MQYIRCNLVVLKILILTATLIVCSSAAEVTRSAGIINYPNLNNNDNNQPDDNYNNNYVNNDNYSRDTVQPRQPAYGGAYNNNGHYSSVGGPNSEYVENPSRIRIILTRNYTYYPDEFKAPDESYYAALGAGKPAKVWNVVMDTGTSETWLPEYKNLNIFAKNLHYRTGYDCRDSTTCTVYSGKYQLQYRGTTLYCMKNRDVLTLYEDMTKEVALVLPSTNAKVQRDFLVVEEASDDQFRYKPYDGVLGLGPKLVSNMGTEHIMLSMMQQYNGHNNFGPGNDWYNMVFSFWFNPNLNSIHGGELVLGGIDESRKIGRVNYHQVMNQDDWMVSLSSLMLGNQVLSCPEGCGMSVDSGANSLVGPREDVYAIHQFLGAQYDQTSNLWQVDCHNIQTFPSVTFIIDDVQYILSPTQYIKQFRYKESQVCHLAIKPWDKHQWLVGTTFMKAFYTVFDLGHRRIGFATPTEE